MNLTIEQFKAEAESLREAAHQFFHSSETAALGKSGGRLAVLSHPNYKSLVTRTNALIADYNSDPAAIAGCNTVNPNDRRSAFSRMTDKYNALWEVRWTLKKGWPNLLTRIRHEESRSQTGNQEAQEPLDSELIYGSDVLSVYGISVQRLLKLANKAWSEELRAAGIKNSSCPFDFDGADWAAHTEELKRGEQCVCSGKVSRSPLTTGKHFNRKCYVRAEIESLLTKKSGSKPRPAGQ